MFAEKCVCENWSYLKRKSISVWRLIEDLRDFRINAAVASRVDSHFTCIIPHPVKWEKKRVHLWSISSLLLLLLYSAKWIPLLAFLKASWRLLIGTFNFGHFYCNTAPLVPLSFEEIHSLILSYSAWSAPFVTSCEVVRKLGSFRLIAPRWPSTAAGAVSLKLPNFLTTSQEVTKGADQAKW